MSPILGIYASQISGKLWEPAGGYDALWSTTLAASTSSITISNIPSTYKHLQLRCFALTNRATYTVDSLKFQLNADTGNNYSWHYLTSAGASPGTTAVSGATTSTSSWANATAGTTVGNYFATTILDILDYTNTNKYKTGRYLSGLDTNGFTSGFAGTVGINSGLWLNTAAINRIDIAPVTGTLFTQYSSFALYGVK
jgi:hypothetical protein